MSIYLPIPVRNMRKCRALFRLFPAARSHYLLTALKIMTIFCILLTIYLFLQEKYEKESLIDLALGSRLTEELVRPDNDTLILNGLDSNGKRKIQNAFVVIIVTSLPENQERRNRIRTSWAKNAHDHGTLVVFFMGKPVNSDIQKALIEEASQYKDLVVDDFQESYYALAIKTLRVLKYFKLYHPKSKFLVKTDDDVFVNVPNLVHYCSYINKRFEEVGDATPRMGMMNPPDREYYVGGVIHGDRGPHTWNSFSKWYAPASVWRPLHGRVLEVQEGESKKGVMAPLNEDSYPPYAEGNFYVMSTDAVIDILNVSKSVPLYHLEDIHVTGVLGAWLLKIQLENIPFISSSSNIFPKLSYLSYKIFTASPKDLIAFHCDNHVELISIIYTESIA